MKSVIPYRRVLLKLSGESLMGNQQFGIAETACHSIALAIKKMRDENLEVGIVIGGGNFFRGITIEKDSLPRTPADHIGMLSTIINGIILQQELLSMGCEASVMSAIQCPQVAEMYSWTKARQYLTEGRVVIFVGGTGNPYFTTDSAAALRASEIEANVLLKATKVDGVYDKDPIKFPDAQRYDELTYSKVLVDRLNVMDATAIALCMNNAVPILVFNMKLLTQESILNVLTKKQGTIVQGV